MSVRPRLRTPLPLILVGVLLFLQLVSPAPVVLFAPVALASTLGVAPPPAAP